MPERKSKVTGAGARAPRSPSRAQPRRRRAESHSGEREPEFGREPEPRPGEEEEEQPVELAWTARGTRARRGRPGRGSPVEKAVRTLTERFRLLSSSLGHIYENVRLLATPRFPDRSSYCLAAFVGILHWLYLTTLFENDRHFSHLSSLEREMSFRVQMGLDYSYFKTIIDAPSFLQGLWMILNDRLTEYPLVINTVKHFHLYPEVIIAYWYRTFIGIMNFLGIETKSCWNTTRLEPLSTVESCEGLGDPACFYVEVIFILNGLMLGLFYLYGAYLSGSQLGGLITVMCYFFNHDEATRVMWTPPLRENFSYPFLVLQMYILTMILRTSSPGRQQYAALCASTVACLLPWQFVQFILFTQIASLFLMNVVGYIESSKFQKIIYMNMISVILCFILMFGDPTYLSSYYSASLLVTWAIILRKNKIQRLRVSELTFWIIQGCAWCCGTIILKFLTCKILGVSHYTPLRYTKTILLPLVLVITYFIFKKIIGDILFALSINTHLRKQLLDHGELTFHALQLLAFTALAILIMRLKLFLTPHMCVMASLICSRQLFAWLFRRVHFKSVVFGILTMMSLQGCINLYNQRNIIGEYSNFSQEELLQWIKYNTRPDAVFAGTMHTMASVKLSTLRPIVNHPHYEYAHLRARTKIVYSAYSRKSAKEVRDKLMELHVNYYILEESWCAARNKPGCSMLEIWDVVDPSNANNPALCSILLKNARPHFTTVFQSSTYQVLKVN